MEANRTPRAGEVRRRMHWARVEKAAVVVVPVRQRSVVVQLQ